MGRIDARLKELGIALPDVAAPVANYVPWVRTGNLVFVSGQVTMGAKGARICRRRRQGFGLPRTAQGGAACGVNVLAALKAALDGDLDRVTRVRQGGRLRERRARLRRSIPKSINGASDLFVEVFGDAGTPRARRGGRGLVAAQRRRRSGGDVRSRVSGLEASAWPVPPQQISARRCGTLWRTRTPRPFPIRSRAMLSSCAGGIRFGHGRAPAGGRSISCSNATARRSALLPLYLKTHSYGEYVFDHGWADAFARAGGRYYPKLQASVPFTPVTGRRLLIAAGEDEARAGTRCSARGRSSGASRPMPRRCTSPS